MGWSPRTRQHLLLDPECCFLLGSAPLSALLLKLDLSEYQNLLKPRPKSHFLLNIVPWMWSATGRHTWYPGYNLNYNVNSPTGNLQIDLVRMLWKQYQEALFCLYFFFGVGCAEITVCNSPRIILPGRRSLHVFKIKAVWKALIAFLSTPSFASLSYSYFGHEWCIITVLKEILRTSGFYM